MCDGRLGGTKTLLWARRSCFPQGRIQKLSLAHLKLQLQLYQRIQNIWWLTVHWHRSVSMQGQPNMLLRESLQFRPTIHAPAQYW